jgi:flagellar assembly factor FliW
MTMKTTHFGPVAIDESSALEFPEGLPGFENCRRFVPLESNGSPGLIFLQSLEQPQLCFITVLLRALWPDYELSIPAEERELLGFEAAAAPADEMALLAVLSFVEGEDPTANLLAPIVVHARTRRAAQIVRQDGHYAVRAPLPAREPVCL